MQARDNLTLIRTHLPLPTIDLSHSTVVVPLPGLQEVWVRIPLVELIFPFFFPSYLSSSPSDLATHSTILSVYHAGMRSGAIIYLSIIRWRMLTVPALTRSYILTHPYILVYFKTLKSRFFLCSLLYKFVKLTILIRGEPCPFG